MILEAEADLVPMGPRSPLRFGRCRTDVPRTSCNPSSARLRLLRGRRPMVQGLASGSVGSWHEVPRTSLAPSSARLRLLRGRRPMGPRSPLRFGRRRADIPRTSCNPSSARLRLLWGRCQWVQGLAFATHLPR